MAEDGRRARWVFAFLLLLASAAAAAVRFHEIGRRSVWFDEGLSLGMAQIPLAELVRRPLSLGLRNQVFYYLALHPWHLLGDDISTVRAFSAVCSVVSVVLTSLLGRRLFGAFAGVSAGSLLALHWFSIRYAQEARGYALATMLTCLAALLLARFVERGRGRDLAGWTLASGLAMYAHFFALFAVASQVFSLVALGPRALLDRRMVLAGIAGIVLLVAPIVQSLSGASHQLLYWVPPVSLESVVQQTVSLAGGSRSLPWLYLVVLGILLVRIVRAADPVSRWGNALCISWALGPLLAIAAVSLWSPILLSRYLVMSIPAWTLAAGAAAGAMLRSKRLMPLACALVGVLLASELGAVGSVYRSTFEDWKTPATLIAAETRPGDTILYETSWSGLALGYYLDRSSARPERLQKGELLFSNDFDKAEASSAERVWLVLSREDAVRSIRLQALLEKEHPNISSKYAGDLRVMLYER